MSKTKNKPGDPCPYCLRTLTEDVFRAKELLRLERLRGSLRIGRENGNPSGRPRNVDYDKILQLRLSGKSLSKIAETLNISRGSVQHALRGMQR